MAEIADKSIGATLRERRLELGISLDEVVARTRIRKSYLEALETEQFDAFPGDTYLKGYLKGYAECLGLDPQVLLRSLAGVHSMAPSPLAPEPEPGPTRSIRPGRGLAWVSALVMVLVVGWWLWGRQAAQPGPGSQPPAVVDQEKELQPPVAGERARPGEPGAQETETAGHSGAESAAGSPGAETPLPASAPAAGSEAAPSTPAPAVADPSIAPGAAGVLRLQATGPGRLEVTIDGRPAQRYILQANTILSWKVADTVRIYLENPGNVRLWLGGREIDPAGRNQIVLQSAGEPSR